MLVRVIKDLIETAIFGSVVIGGAIGFLMLVGVITWL